MPAHLKPKHKPSHAKPSKAAPALAVGGLTATIGAAGAGTAHAATDNDFARLRGCESGGNYAVNTGNGYYGAYQFDIRTWRGLGYDGLPSTAAPGTQDEAAALLQSQRGWQPWPACSRKLGLSSAATRSGGTVVARASRGGVRTVLAELKTTRATPAPAFSGTVLSAALVKQDRTDVRTWQKRMVARGWDLAVDGRFGPRSAAVAARFAKEKGLPTAPGTVDAALWTATWAAAVV